MSSRQFVKYVKSLPPEVDAALRREVLKHPEAMVGVVKKIREMASDPSISERRRRAFQRLLRERIRRRIAQANRMIASIYARKSTEQPGVADEQRSVTRQVEHARLYAARKGWIVDDAHVYVDDGISGAEFANRPGFLRLMSALKPRPPFNALIMSEESRLGREAIETAYALKQLVAAGVRVFFYLEDRERTLDSPTDKIMLSLTAFADEIEREKARQRTTDAMVRKARARLVTGGRVFGYTNERRADGVHLVINEEEAAVVRRIFALVSDGCGLSRVAKTLNEEGVRRPRPQQGRPAGWAPSSIRAVLYRELYRGVSCWNKTRKRDRWGAKAPQARPESEWLRVEVPELAIVPDALWKAAHVAISRQRERYGQRRQFAHQGRSAGADAADTRYLLTGLLSCAHCNGGMEIRSRSHGRTRVPFIGCSSYQRRGRAVCPVKLTVPESNANAAVLASLKRCLLNERVLEAAVHRAVALICEPDDDGSAVRRQLDQVERELERLTRAIELGGGEVSVLVAALRVKEQQRRDLRARVRVLDDSPMRFEPGDVLNDLHTRLSEWEALMNDEPGHARAVCVS
jgi:DNA invertase Pin-like site-specific DNA recombinase